MAALFLALELTKDRMDGRFDGVYDVVINFNLRLSVIKLSYVPFYS